MVKVTMKFFRRIIWISFLILFFQDNLSWGSGGSIISAGAFGSSGGDTGHRQLIKLQVNGDLLSAIPQCSSIKLITIHAPGLKGGHLIIRELDLPDSQKSILITVPNGIRTHIERATIYLSSASDNFTLYHQNESGWGVIDPIKLITTSPLLNINGLDEILAYPVDRLGHFRIFYHPQKMRTGAVPNNTDLKTGTIPIGSVRRGLFPCISAGILFIVISILSYIIHKMERAGSN